MTAKPSEATRKLLIRAAPKIKSKSKRKTRSEPYAGLETSARREEDRAGTTPILGAILLLGCAATFVILAGPRGPDAHLIRAKELIARYEESRMDEVRDYESSAYRSALDELDQVRSASPSGAEAAALAREIRSRIEAQRVAAKSRTEEISARQERRQGRDERFFEAQKRSRLVISGEHDVCEDEGTAPHAERRDHSSARAEEEPQKAE